MLRPKLQGNRRCSAFVAAVCAVLVIGTGTSCAQTIYDSQVLTRMEFTPSQREKVERVIEESGQTMSAIFKKYGIDPEAKPDFEKLREARHELQDLEATEKRKMKAIMTRKQFKYYMGLIQQTAANVIRATRNKP